MMMLSKVLVILLLLYAKVDSRRSNATSVDAVPEADSYARCLDRQTVFGSSQRSPLALAQNAWTSSQINVNIARILLSEVVGIPTAITKIDEVSMWQEIAEGNIHACLEYWPATSQDKYTQYILTERSILNAGPLGIVGQIGWYVPTYVLDVYPSVYRGNFNETIASYFGNKLYVGSSTWTTRDKRIIEDQNFNLTIVTLGGEQELIDLIRVSYERKDPILFYFWTPHPILGSYELTKVDFPALNKIYPAEILGKLLWSGLYDYSLAGVYFLQSFTLTTETSSELLSQLFAGNSYFDVACNWVKNNEALWNTWILPVNYRLINNSAIITMYVISSFSLVVVMFYLVTVLAKRNSKVMIAASRTFLIAMCIGGILMYGSVITFSTLTDTGCALFEWFLATGFGMLFGSLFAKNGRIYLLLSNRSLKIVKYTDKDVGFIVLMILLGEWVLLIIGQIMQAPNYSFISTGTIEYNFCTFHYPTGVALLVYNGALVIFGIIVSVLINYIKLTLYSESKYIALAIYNFGLAAAFVLAIILIQDPLAKFTVVCIGILFLTNMALGLIFLPKIYLALKYTDAELRLRNDLEINRAIQQKARSRTGSAPKNTANNNNVNNNQQQESSIRVSSYIDGNTSVMTSDLSSIEGELGKLISNTRKLHEENAELKNQNLALKKENEELKRKLLSSEHESGSSSEKS